MMTTTDVRGDDVGELLPAFALGALDRDGMIAVAGHLADCADCRAALADYEAVVDSLSAVTPVQPPAELRDRVLAATQSPPRDSPRTGFAPAVVPSSRRLRFVAYGLAAAAVVLIAAVAILAALLADARDSRDEASEAEAQLASYLSAGGDVLAMTALPAADYGHYGVGRGSLVTAPDMPPLIVVGNCPKTNEDREYRVWVERDGDRSRVGVLNVGSEGTGWLTFETPEPLTSYDSIGVTMVTNDEDRSDLFIGVPVSATT